MSGPSLDRDESTISLHNLMQSLSYYYAHADNKYINLINNSITKIQNHQNSFKNSVEYLDVIQEFRRLYPFNPVPFRPHVSSALDKLKEYFKANVTKSGVLYLADYSESKSILTTYILNAPITTQTRNVFNIPSRYIKIGDYSEKLLDDLLVMINDALDRDTAHKIRNPVNGRVGHSVGVNGYHARCVKKGGLVLRNVFNGIRNLMNILTASRVYKFTNQIITSSQALLNEISDYDVTMIFYNYSLINPNDQVMYQVLLDRCYTVIKHTIIKDMQSPNSLVFNIIDMIKHQFSDPINMTVEKMKKDVYDILPPNCNYDVYEYNDKQRVMMNTRVRYNDKKNLVYSFKEKDMEDIYGLNIDIINPFTGTPYKKPLTFSHNSITPTPQLMFQLLRILGLCELSEYTVVSNPATRTANGVLKVFHEDINGNPLPVPKEAFSTSRFEMLDISIDLIINNVIHESEIERETYANRLLQVQNRASPASSLPLQLSFNSVLYDNFNMFITPPSKAAKRCKRLRIVLSIYNAIIAIKKYNQNNGIPDTLDRLYTDWFDKASVVDKENFMKIVYDKCLSMDIQKEIGRMDMNNIKFYNVTEFIDNISYELKKEKKLSKVLRQDISFTLTQWNKDLFIEFNNKFSGLNTFATIGPMRFIYDLSNNLINTQNFVNRLNTYPMSFDGFVIVDDTQTAYSPLLSSFIDAANISLNTILNRYLLTFNNSSIKESSFYWDVVSNVKRSIFFKENIVKQPQSTKYFPFGQTQDEKYPVYSTVIEDNNPFNFPDIVSINPYPYLRYVANMNFANFLCGSVKEATLIDINVISLRRLNTSFNSVKNYHSAQQLILSSNNRDYITPIYILYFMMFNTEFNKIVNQNDKYLLAMLLCTWFNNKLSINPENNLYMFVHYAIYFINNNLYNNIFTYLQRELTGFFHQRNISVINYFSLPAINSINTIVNRFNNFDDDMMLSELEKNYHCENAMDLS